VSTKWGRFRIACAQARIKIEHTFSRRKYGIASDIYRNRDEDYDQTMNIVGGLVNLRAYERIFQEQGCNLSSNKVSGSLSFVKLPYHATGLLIPVAGLFIFLLIGLLIINVLAACFYIWVHRRQS
jgi:hypothetical protein